MDDDTFLKRFEAAEWSADQWHHREHIKVAYLYLRKYPAAEALERVRAGIQALNAAQKVPEGPARGYHETMTLAWMRLVQHALTERGPAASSDQFFERHPELGNPKRLADFYSRDHLMSLEAKRMYVEPDLAPLPGSKALYARPP